MSGDKVINHHGTLVGISLLHIPLPSGLSNYDGMIALNLHSLSLELKTSKILEPLPQKYSHVVMEESPSVPANTSDVFTSSDNEV